MRPKLPTEKNEHGISDKHMIDLEAKKDAEFNEERKEKTETKRYFISASIAISGILLTILGLKFFSC